MAEWTTSCPNCGDRITFQWSSAIQTTCPSCRSILVRHDVDIRKVGVVGQVPPATSRIRIGTEGRFKGTPFTVVGRIVYRYGRGHWSEWHLRMADDSSAWLSDAQGDYVFTRQVDARAPAQGNLTVGRTLQLGKTEVQVVTVTRAQYVAVEGELPFEYWDKGEVFSADFRSGSDGFGTIDYSEDPPLVYMGEYESFTELKLEHLLDEVRPDADLKARSLTCANCGAGIELRIAEVAQTVACAACGAIMDTSDPGLARLVEVQKKLAVRPVIPLGSVGTFRGAQWRVVGFQVRAVMVAGVEYSWHEYLLWNLDEGFRYLTEYEGHWNDVATVKGLPVPGSDGGHPTVSYRGTTFRNFQNATAVTKYVLGEFPWEVRAGDQVRTEDYVSPPLMLSRESTDDEVTWSMGTYTEPDRIAQAFGLKKTLRRPTGVFANQPNPLAGAPGGYVRVFAVFAALLLAMMFVRAATARDESVFAESYSMPAATGAPPAFVTRAFDLGGGTSNVEVRIETSLSNDWAFFDLALLSEDGSRGYEVGRNLSNYYGVDDGEAWHEGSPRDRALIARVPPGRYYLRVAVEHPPSPYPTTYELAVRRDVPRQWPYLVALVLLALVPAIVFIRRATFETRRWQESDYATAEEDDDEE